MKSKILISITLAVSTMPRRKMGLEQKKREAEEGEVHSHTLLQTMFVWSEHSAEEVSAPRRSFRCECAGTDCWINVVGVMDGMPRHIAANNVLYGSYGMI